jgi:hypothetical protein
MMKSAVTWFVILTTICVVGPYLLGVRPRTRRHWTYLALTIAFLALMLPLVSSLRSR